MAGLVRKRVTVRGKKRTYQRTVMVKSGQSKPAYMKGKPRNARSSQGQMSLGQFMRAHGKHYMKVAGAQGAVGGLGAYTGYHTYKKDRAMGAAAGSLAGGLGVTALADRSRKTKALYRDYKRLGAGSRMLAFGAGALANLAGHGVGIAAAHGVRRGVQRLRKNQQA